MKKNRKKKTEFSKIVVAWSLVFMSLAAVTSYVLAALGHETAEGVTIAIITECIAIVAGYMAKSYGEKNSRNKYNVTIDEDSDDE